MGLSMNQIKLIVKYFWLATRLLTANRAALTPRLPAICRFDATGAASVKGIRLSRRTCALGFIKAHHCAQLEKQWSNGLKHINKASGQS